MIRANDVFRLPLFRLFALVSVLISGTDWNTSKRIDHERAIHAIWCALCIASQLYHFLFGFFFRGDGSGCDGGGYGVSGDGGGSSANVVYTIFITFVRRLMVFSFSFISLFKVIRMFCVKINSRIVPIISILSISDGLFSAHSHIFMPDPKCNWKCTFDILLSFGWLLFSNNEKYTGTTKSNAIRCILCSCL